MTEEKTEDTKEETKEVQYVPAGGLLRYRVNEGEWQEVVNRTFELMPVLVEHEDEEDVVFELEAAFKPAGGQDGPTKWMPHPLTVAVDKDGNPVGTRSLKEMVEIVEKSVLTCEQATQILNTVLADLAYTSTITGAAVTLLSDVEGIAGFARFSLNKQATPEDMAVLANAAKAHGEQLVEKFNSKKDDGPIIIPG
jgi:hypothetical protein